MLFRHLWVNTEIRAEKNFTKIRPYFTQHKHTRGFVKPCVKIYSIHFSLHHSKGQTCANYAYRKQAM